MRTHPGSIIVQHLAEKQRDGAGVETLVGVLPSLLTACTLCYPVSVGECRVSGPNLRTAGFLHIILVLFFLHSWTHPGSIIVQHLAEKQRDGAGVETLVGVLPSLLTACTLCYPVSVGECRVSGPNLRTAGFLHIILVLFFLHSW
ncbi:hypothetical protein PBY51_016828 [Eleginops maclovinus]|uniref:Uncharacterized protein n=1 Tax=Eleginops maclovinus TaxID=56733 RepID=A0AAN7ZU38_ELEMC|nr:hypothetical protein PBY51_016828 [Eleginops maclovinus]